MLRPVFQDQLPDEDAYAAEFDRAEVTLGVLAQDAVNVRIICTPLGMHPEFFFPENAGRDYELSPYLEVVKDFRNDFTVISGLSHPDVGPSHDSK